ncbi:MAG: lactate/malate dehydrogenase family protein [Gemmataceae bacterium]
MKVSILGGGGLVGSSAAYALQMGGKVSHVCLIDTNADLAKGHAYELLNSAALTSDVRVSAGSMEDISSTDIVVITAGLRRKPDESRLDLINRNVDLFLSLLSDVLKAGLKNSAYLLVVSNPVDVLTYLAVQRSGLPWQRVLGLGTQLDTARLRGVLGQMLGVPPSQINALILGEHGDSMVPIWSSAAINGLPLAQWPGYSPGLGMKAFEETKTAGATLIKLKGGSGMAVGHSIREVVEAISGDLRRVLPVSTLQQGLYGLRDVCLSVPTVVGCGGCRQQIALTLLPKEQQALQQSARVLRDIIDQVESRISKVRAETKLSSTTPTLPRGNAVPEGLQRSIPRSAWGK